MAVNERDDLDMTPEDGRIAALYRAAATEEPPAHLDRAIRDLARPAPAPARRAPWWSMWRVPFAAAALVIVSASVVTLMLEEGAHKLDEMPGGTRAPQTAQAPEPPREAQSPQSPPTVPPPALQPEARYAPPAPSQPSEPARAKTEARPADNREAERAQEELRRERRAESAREAPRAEEKREAVTAGPAAAAPAAAPEPTRVPPVQSESATRDAQPFSLEKRAAPVPPTIGIRGLDSNELDRAARPAPSAPAASAPAPPPAPIARSAPAQAEPQAFPAPPAPAPQIQATPAPAMPAPAAKAAPPPPPKPEAKPAAKSAPRADAAGRAESSLAAARLAALTAELEGKSAGQWLERVATLRREGRPADATALLEEFRQRFPDQPIPPALLEP